MTTASVAELKSGLSRYLREVQRGGEILVTSHRHPVARLLPVRGDALSIYKPATRPLSTLAAVRGIKPLKPVDVVALLREERDRR